MARLVSELPALPLPLAGTDLFRVDRSGAPRYIAASDMATYFGGGGDAATLNGQPGSYYLNASNLNAGTVADARLSANLQGWSALATSSKVNNLSSGSNTIGLRWDGLGVVTARIDATDFTLYSSGNFDPASKVNKAGDTGLGTLTFNNDQTLIQAAGGAKILTGPVGATFTAQAGGATNTAFAVTNSVGTVLFNFSPGGQSLNESLVPLKLPGTLRLMGGSSGLGANNQLIDFAPDRWLTYNSTDNFFSFGGAPLRVDANVVWHAGNDGAGSGLDADLLDGVQGSGYVNTTGAQSISGAKTFTTTTRITGQSFAYIRGGTDARLTFEDSAGVRRGMVLVTPSGGTTSLIAYDTDGGTELGRLNVGTGGLTYGGNTVWHSGNLVPSSGTRALADTETSYSTTVAQIGEGTTDFPGTAGATLTAKHSNIHMFQLYAPAQGGSGVPDLYFRTSHTTLNGGGWTGLQKVWHAGNDGAGSGLNADLLDGYNADAGAGANTVAVRTGSSDIYARLFRSTYIDQSGISGAMAFRVNNAGDEYIRFCNNTANIRTYLGLGTAATQNTGTSGATVPLLNGNNTFSGTATFSNAAGINVSAGPVQDSIGNLRDIPQNVQNANYTFVLADRGKHVIKTDTTAYSWTVPPNSSVAFAIGTAITLVNDGTSGNINVLRGSGVTLMLGSVDGDHVVGVGTSRTLLKVGTDRWRIL